MDDVTCPVNIGPRGRRQRLVLALFMGALLAALLVWYATQDPPRSARWWVVVPLFVGGLGLFQALAGT